MNAIQLLKEDHRTVLALFRRFEKAGEGAHREKQAIARQVVKELSKHAAVEEQFLYPSARVRDPRLDDIVLEALEEHHVAKWTLDELDQMSPSDERFDAKMTVLAENIRHHIEEEEETLFPRLQKVMGKDELDALGEVIAQAKKIAPTHPHPMAPDTPPGNVVAGALAKILDLGRDAGREVAERARNVFNKRVAAVAKSATRRSKRA